MSAVETVSLRDRYRGGLLGLAAGDALGTTLEFRPPGTFSPIRDIVGGGPFGLEPGQWTDDTSMALCLAESLVAREGFDARDQMERYLRWYRHGHLSSTGTCFDIGNTTSAALASFERTGEPFSGPTAANSSGNGSLMRLVPVALAFANDPATAVHLAGESSRTTHGSQQAVDACRYFATLLIGALQGVDRDELLGPQWDPGPALRNQQQRLTPAIAEVAAGSFRDEEPPVIRGTGYVVKSLEAALWAVWGATSFREACLRAANLGDDADTTGAIAGQLAGCLWGIGGDRGIPEEWLTKLARRAEIETLTDGLLKLASQRGPQAADGSPNEHQHADPGRLDDDFFAGRSDDLPPFELPVPEWHTDPGVFPWVDIGQAGSRLIEFAHRYPYDWSSDPQRPQQHELVKALAKGEPQDPVEGETAFLRRCLLAHARADRFSEGTVANNALALTRIANELRRRLLAEPGGSPYPEPPPPPLPAALQPRAFWVAAPRLLAGAYPGAPNSEDQRAKLDALLQLGVTNVVTLMEQSEVGHGGVPFRAYAPYLEAAGVVVERRPIRDVSTPSVAMVVSVLDTIDRALDAGGTVYVHCWGGRGRTGVIVGCWLVRHGWIDPHNAAAELTRMRERCADAAYQVPDTAGQLQRITTWKPSQ